MAMKLYTMGPLLHPKRPARTVWGLEGVLSTFLWPPGVLSMLNIVPLPLPRYYRSKVLSASICTLSIVPTTQNGDQDTVCRMWHHA